MSETAMTSHACACGTCAGCSAAAASGGPDRAFRFRHAQLRARMMAQIAQVEVEGQRPLAGLGTRALDDPAIALIDAQAACLHVLAWNAGRLGDDATIQRSEDRDALVALSRLLGYEPRPALSATTTLAFTLDDFPGSPGKAVIPAGTKVASLPAQDELPQTFETDLAIEARAAWNRLTPVQQPTPDSIKSGATSIWVAGVALPVRAGDHLLMLVGGACKLAIVTGTEQLPEKDRDRTRIDFVTRGDVDRDSSVPALAADEIVVLGARAAPFGATAPDARLMPKGGTATDNNASDQPLRWKDFKVGAPNDPEHDRVDLDAVHPEAVKGRLAVFVAHFSKRRKGVTKFHRFAAAGMIRKSQELSRTDYGMSAKVTRIRLRGIPLRKQDAVPGAVTRGYFGPYVRETTIYLETARARLFRFDEDRALPGDLSALDVPGVVELPAGRRVAIAGEAWANGPGKAGTPCSEIAEISKVEIMKVAPASHFTRLHFVRPLQRRYRSTTLTVNANCAPASHGETLAGGAEILGSGAATALAPRFALARGPLAYVPADTPRGYAPALEVRVDDRRYDEVPMLYGQPEGARSYTVREVAGRSEVQFAAHLPGGTYNVTARYRTGGGKAGLLGPGRLTSLLSPVLGVSGATNPLATEGGSDAAAAEELRAAAPRWVRSLDRVVSLADYETFAGDYRGVGKAMATELHDGMRALVLLTVADSALRPPASGSEIMTGLASALAKCAVPGRKVQVQGFVDYFVILSIKLATDAAVPREKVEAAVRAALATRFGRAHRRFGQGLHRSELLAVIQAVPGVRAAVIASWQRALADPFTPQTGAGEGTLRLQCPAVAIDALAGLLSVSAEHITFTELEL